MADQPLYLEDFTAGERYVSGEATITEVDIKRFAGEFDPQPFHVDAAAAKGAFFGGLAASGWHTAAITKRLMVETGLPFAGGTISAGGEIQWPAPARPGICSTL